MTGTATTYEVTVAGHLDDHWSDWLGGLTISRHPDGTTTLTGPATDQAQLHGVLGGLRDVGAELLALQVKAPHPTALLQPLQTPRLTLRAATVADAEATWAYRRRDDVSTWLTGTPETYDAYLTQFGDPARLATTVVVERHDGTLLGDFMLRRQDAWAQAEVTALAAGREVELGWVLDPGSTGHGYATEAVAGLLRHSFEDLGVHRVVASCFADNVASWRLMERLGMRRESHTVRDALHRSGEWLDSYGYALLADEWARLDGQPST